MSLNWIETNSFHHLIERMVKIVFLNKTFLTIRASVQVSKKRTKRKSKQVHSKLSESCKFDPEGTRGSIGPEMVPLSSSRHWPYYGVKKIVIM